MQAMLAGQICVLHGKDLGSKSCWAGLYWQPLVLQVLAGQVPEAAGLLANWSAAWHHFGWLPEMFEMSLDHRPPTQSGWLLKLCVFFFKQKTAYEI